MESSARNRLGPVLDTSSFRWRVLFVAGVIFAGWFLHVTAPLWLIFFASILGAVVLSTLTRWIARALHISAKASLGLLLALIAGGLAAAAWTAYPSVSREIRAFLEDWPTMLEHFKLTWLGRRIFDGGGDQSAMETLTSLGAPMAGTAMTVFTALSMLFVCLFLTLFLAYNPSAYVRRVERAFPPSRREQARTYLSAVGHALERWLLGQLFAMAVIAVVMVTALSLLGVSYPLTLGILAGLFQFVPYLGPFLWAIPAALIAATSSWTEAALVLLIYSIVQAFEGNLLTPLVQQRAVELPPVLTLLGTVLFGLLFGPLGIMVATPLLVVVLVSYDRLWLQRIERSE